MRLNDPNFNLSKVEGINKHTMKTEFTFGKYKGEIIASVFEYDSEYIIHLYDMGIIDPDDGLLKVIHKTKDDIENRDIDRTKRELEKETWEVIFGKQKRF